MKDGVVKIEERFEKQDKEYIKKLNYEKKS